MDTNTAQTTSPVVMNPPSDMNDLNSVVNVSPDNKKDNKKLWMAIGILVILGAIGIATYLVQRKSFTQSLATSGTGCSVSFNEPTQDVCWMEPRTVPITYTVHSLPASGGPFYMQTDWYIAAPTAGPNHYDESQQIVAGQSYTIYAEWPGITGNQTIEIHAGLNVVNSNHNLLSPNCTGGIDYYWTPYTVCTQPSVTVTSTLTPTEKPSGTPSITVTPNLSESPTPTPTGPTVTPTDGPTSTPGPSNTPTPTGTTQGTGDELAAAGFGTPTIIGLAAGMFLIMGALLLAL